MLSLGRDLLKSDCIDEWIQLKPMYQNARDVALAGCFLIESFR
jgi:hypothetical protein